ncbi:MAG: DNA polymerase III subunit gamma/tau [Bacteroidales bacterium]|nr:DNA polymerase III subunit gamma/tau [Bacteroidales bacterium]
MEQYIVSARKYRPSTFASVVGQQALTATLKNAIATDRLAHAYLFCGSRGVGKTSCARIFAKTINCTSRTPEGEACNRCDSCRQFNENRSMNIIELDAASNNGVDDIRQLVEQVMVPPATGRYRVFIIDEVHMLSSQAFNAFLKTLEEPPSYVVFILATTEKHKIIPTILSRCQIYDFNRISIADMVKHLQAVAANEGMSADPAALNVIARKADGAMRDALSIFDQVAASTRGNITYDATIENLNILDESYYNRLVDAFIAQDVATSLLIYKEIREKGFDSQFFINGLGLYLRDLMVAANPATITLLEATDEVRAEMAARAAKLHPTFLYKAMALCNDADFNFRAASNKQFLIELTLIRLCQLLSPSPDESGSDEGQMRPLESFTTSSPAPHPIQAPADMPQTPAQAPRTAASAAPRTAKSSAAAAALAAAATTAPQQVQAQTPAYSLGGLSLSMRGAAKKAPEETAAQAAETPVQTRTKPYSDADLENAWRTVRTSFPAEPMLTGIIQAATPVGSGGGKYVLSVGTEMQADIVGKHLKAILSILRNMLSNDEIDISVEVCEGEIPPAFWTDTQVLEHIVAAHPAVAAMINKYKMRLN